MLNLNKNYFIILILFVFGCQTNKLYDGLKTDFGPEKEAKIFNKTSSSNNYKHSFKWYDNC